jgi:hypothetical protein
MADKKIAFEMTANADGVTKSVGSLKSQLREAQADVAALSDKFGATSKEAIEAAKRAGELKDKIGDAKALTDAYNPDAKFKAFGSAIQGVVGGFTALQGVQGLFGSKSEELEKTLLKVQSAMALTQGLNSVLEAKDSFTNLAGFIKTNVVSAFGTLKNAIISTGIGALVIGIGLVIANFDKLKNSGGLVGKIFRGIGDVISFVVDKAKALTDWMGITGDSAEESAQRQIDASKKLQKETETRYDTEIKYARAAGKDVFELEIKKRDAVYETLKQQLRALYALKGANKEFTDDQKKQVDEVTKAIFDNEVEKNTLIISKNKETNDALTKLNKEKEDKEKQKADKNKQAAADEKKKREEANKERLDQAIKDQEESIKRNQEEKKKKIQFQNELFKALQELSDQQDAEDKEKQKKKLDDKKKAAELAVLNDPSSSENKIAKLQADLEAENSLLDANDLQRQINTKNTENAITAIKDAEAKKQAEIEKMKVQVVGNALSAISDLIGKDTAAGKALAIATALINTYQGASEAIKEKSVLPQPFSTIQKIASVAAIIATGIRTVKAITSVKVPGGGGGGAVPSVAGLSVAAPITPQAQTTTLNQGQINQIGNATVRAYVMDRDVENNRDRISRLNRAARIN